MPVCRRRLKAQMACFTRPSTLNILRIFWTLIIIWFEYGIFISNSRQCAWPDAALYPPNFEIVDLVKPTHVLIIADPQILDRYSYPSRGPLLSWLTRLVVDLNLRKNWHASLKHKPDAIVILGDMMDNGRYIMSDEEYETYYQRFKTIFKENKGVPHYFLPGNHDIGLGQSSSFSPHAYTRYTSHFGTPNFEVSLANHTLIMFDAPSYADEDAKRHGQKKSIDEWVPIPGRSLEFMKKFTSAAHTDPVILFSHIPMYRHDGKSCGRLREKGTLRPGVGLGYQNTLEKHASKRLLEALEPIVVFSGDDHDYCEYTHYSDPQNGLPRLAIPEVTVKTLSMVMNVRRPGFQLLSLAPTQLRDHDIPTYKDVPCLLPDQIRIYLNIYPSLLAVSIIIVCIANFSFPSSWRSPSVEKSSLTEYALSSSSSSSSLSAIVEEDDRELHHEDLEKLGPINGFTTTSSSLPSPITATFRSTRASRSSRGWRIFTPENQYQDQSSPTNYLKTLLYSFWSGRSPLNFPFQQRRRKSWLMATLRDIRDIAVFPLGAFVIITWWMATI